MADGLIIRRGGSAGAALQVMAVSSAAALPASAKESTIAIITSTAIGAVYAQAGMPTTASNGDVLITADNAAHTVNMAAKGAVMVSIGACYQMTGGAWNKMDAYVYRGGAWQAVTGCFYLYNVGNPMEHITGGWAATDDGSGTCAMDDDSIYFETTSSLSRRGAVTQKAIDMTGYSKLCMDVDVLTFKGGSTQMYLGVHTTNNPKTGTTSVTKTSTKVYPYCASRMTVEYDVSSVTEAMYVWASLANGSVASIRIRKIWLE